MSDPVSLPLSLRMSPRCFGCLGCRTEVEAMRQTRERLAQHASHLLDALFDLLRHVLW